MGHIWERLLWSSGDHQKKLAMMVTARNTHLLPRSLMRSQTKYALRDLVVMLGALCWNRLNYQRRSTHSRRAPVSLPELDLVRSGKASSNLASDQLASRAKRS